MDATEGCPWYVFHDGYWAPEVGFYGGIDYGFGYTGDGYEGGYWNNGAFFYNTAVNNITNSSVTNVFHKPVTDRNRSRISHNGGPGGVRARPTSAQLAIAREHRVPATAEQRRHAEAAARNPAMALSHNHGPSVSRSHISSWPVQWARGSRRAARQACCPAQRLTCSAAGRRR